MMLSFLITLVDKKTAFSLLYLMSSLSLVAKTIGMVIVLEKMAVKSLVVQLMGVVSRREENSYWSYIGLIIAIPVNIKALAWYYGGFLLLQHQA